MVSRELRGALRNLDYADMEARRILADACVDEGQIRWSVLLRWGGNVHWSGGAVRAVRAPGQRFYAMNGGTASHGLTFFLVADGTARERWLQDHGAVRISRRNAINLAWHHRQRALTRGQCWLDRFANCGPDYQTLPEVLVRLPWESAALIERLARTFGDYQVYFGGETP